MTFYFEFFSPLCGRKKCIPNRLASFAPQLSSKNFQAGLPNYFKYKHFMLYCLSLFSSFIIVIFTADQSVWTDSSTSSFVDSSSSSSSSAHTKKKPVLSTTDISSSATESSSSNGRSSIWGTKILITGYCNASCIAPSIITPPPPPPMITPSPQIGCK